MNAWRARVRRRELARSRPHLSTAALTAALDALPIPRESVVLVHSSLKSLGFVEGGADGVVTALIASIVTARGGTLMLPSYSIDGRMLDTLASGRAFDARTTASNLGAIPEAFRRHPGVLRSCHPTHSFAAIGPRAHWLLDGHHLAATSFGEGTPLARLRETDSRLLGLGSDIGHVTYYHCLEDIEPFPFEVYAPGIHAVECIDFDGVSHTLRLRGHAGGAFACRRIDHPDNAALRMRFTAALEQEAGLTWHQVGTARCWLVDGRSMYQTIKDLLYRGVTIYA